MIDITIKQLRYFQAVARHVHFGKAAEACSVSQPALSMQIRELELALEAPVFERSARYVRLTAFGEQFAERTQEILQRVDELGDLAQVFRDGRLGKLRFGVIATIAPYVLPKLINRFNETYDGLELHIRESLTATLLDELKAGMIDMALLALPISDPALSEMVLCEEEFVLVRPEADAGLEVPPRDSLSEMRLLLLEQGHCFRDQTLSFCRIAPATTRSGLDGSSLTTLVQMVSSGIGITLIPKMAVGVETVGTAVDVAEFSGEKPTRTIGMVWRKNNPFVEQLTAVAKEVQHVLID